MAEVILQDVRKVYVPEKGPEVTAVQYVNLEVKKGELMVLVGPSGCGKSTLLRLIAGLETIDGGTIQIGGQVVNNVAPKDRDIAMVFQNYALFPHMTVWENMAFSLKFRRVPKAEIQERVMEAAQLLHLEEVLERKPKALSGGQRQRTALGRALVRRPRVFLLDEPLSNLDAQMRAEMRAEIAKLHARLGITMIYVTHDQAEAMTLGERLAVLNRGRLMQVGAPLEVYQRPQNMFVAGFLGSPGMNLLHGRIETSSGQLAFIESSGSAPGIKLVLAPDRFRNSAALAGKPACLGIRPEDVEVISSGSGESVSSEGYETKIEICEPMGHETLLHFRTASHTLIARTPSTTNYSLGQSVRLRLKLERATLFDPQTQEAVV